MLPLDMRKRHAPRGTFLFGSQILSRIPAGFGVFGSDGYRGLGRRRHSKPASGEPIGPLVVPIPAVWCEQCLRHTAHLRPALALKRKRLLAVISGSAMRVICDHKFCTA